MANEETSHMRFALTRRAVLTGGLASLAAGCFGEFAATRALYRWNTEASDNKWLRWLVFLGLAILPVYSLFILADALVLNTIEFFSGTNPVSGGRLSLGGGHTLTSSRTDDPDVIRHEHHQDGKLVRVLYVRRVGDDEMLLLDEDFALISRVSVAADGSARALDRQGREQASLDAKASERARRAIEAGGSISHVLDRELGAARAWARVADSR